jgi:hypothetical protein
MCMDMYVDQTVPPPVPPTVLSRTQDNGDREANYLYVHVLAESCSGEVLVCM